MELHTGWRTATERDGSFESGPSARFWSVDIVYNGPLWFAKPALTSWSGPTLLEGCVDSGYRRARTRRTLAGRL